MDMEAAAVFMSASILVMMTFVVISVGVIVVNNLFHKYWKPINLFSSMHSPARFATAEELAHPHNARFATAEEIDIAMAPKMEPK